MKTTYRNRLPHIAPVGATFFITFRLWDSLPWRVVHLLKAKMENAVAKLDINDLQCYNDQLGRIRKSYFKQYEHQLDANPFGACYLKNPEVAEIVKAKLKAFDGRLYTLIAYCVMPNHVHVLFDTKIQLFDEDNCLLDEVPEDYVQLHQIMKRIKGGTAVAANKLLGRSGTFWQKDSYDHFVRNEREKGNIINYIAQNPVKAGLVDDWRDFPHTFVRGE